MSQTLNPDFPIIEGDYQLTESWQLHLGQKFNRRIDGGSMVLWRPGLTLWVDAYGNDHELNPDDQIATLIKDSSPAAYDKQSQPGATVSRASYKLDEDHDGKNVLALYSFTASSAGVLVLGIYADSEEDLHLAQEIIESIQPV